MDPCYNGSDIMPIEITLYTSKLIIFGAVRPRRMLRTRMPIPLPSQLYVIRLQEAVTPLRFFCAPTVFVSFMIKFK